MAVCIAVPAAQSVSTAIRLTRSDGRETARVWIADNIPPGAHIALEAYSAWADPQRYEILGLRRITDHKPQWYIDNGYDYLVFGQDMFSRFYNQPQRYASYVAEYEAMFSTFELVQNFTDGGYQVMIYRVVRP